MIGAHGSLLINIYMRARDIITIAEAFKVYDAYREQTVFIHYNPSKSVVDAQFKRFTYLRGLLYGGNSLYIWDAELLHDEVVAAIGRGQEPRQRRRC